MVVVAVDVLIAEMNPVSLRIKRLTEAEDQQQSRNDS
jgi:hypothetical protein